MADYVTLLGSEEVARAASRMESAAASMNSAAYSMDAAVDRLERVLTNFTQELNGALQDRISDLGVTMGPLA